MTKPAKTSNILYEPGMTAVFTDCKTCFEYIKESLKSTKNSRVEFNIVSYESEDSSECLAKVCLINKFSENICHFYSKSIQVKGSEESVYLFGSVEVLDENTGLYPRVRSIYPIKLDQIFYVREIKEITLDTDNKIYFDILIYCKGIISPLVLNNYQGKDFYAFLDNETFQE
jgi:hypothetical protein